MKSSYDNNDTFADLNEVFSPAEVGRITKMKLDRMGLNDNGDAVFDESLNALKSSMQKKTAQQTSTPDQLAELISKLRQG